MLKIRLQRVGRKHEPSFRLVLTDSKNSTKSGKSIETLGNYDSRRGEKSVINTERVKHWMSQGAQVSTTVHNILITNKIIEGKKINALPLKKAIVKEEAPKAAEVAEAPKTEEAEVTAEESSAVEAPVEEKVEEKSEEVVAE